MIAVIQADHTDHQHLMNQVYKMRARNILAAPRDYHAANDIGLVKEAADQPDAVYIVVISEEKTVIGSWRINNTIYDLLEINRFDLDLDYAAQNGELAAIDQIVSKLFYALCHLALVKGVERAAYNYNECFSRILERIGCPASQLDPPVSSNGRSFQRGYFSLDKALLETLRLQNESEEIYIHPSLLK